MQEVVYIKFLCAFASPLTQLIDRCQDRMAGMCKYAEEFLIAWCIWIWPASQRGGENLPASSQHCKQFHGRLCLCGNYYSNSSPSPSARTYESTTHKQCQLCTKSFVVASTQNIIAGINYIFSSSQVEIKYTCIS